MREGSMERATFLTGEFRHTVDDRGRVAIPVRFRPRMAHGATVARWLDGCLGVFPRDAWDALAIRMADLPTTSATAREFVRFMASGAVDVDLDGQGRILLPAYLREYGELSGGEVVVVGALSRLELWAPARWDTYRRKLEDAPEEIAERLQELGL
jgi:MraZ protein